MRILFIGDVVGLAGLKALSLHLPRSIKQWKVDLTVVNGENSAIAGFGISKESFDEIIAAGADVVTLGNHSWNRKEALGFIEPERQLIRPINYLPGTPGVGFIVAQTKGGQRALVINALGRLFMEPINDPFGLIDQVLNNHVLGRDVDAIVVDFHCEATGEKQAMGHFCDGRVSVVVGTHTHTPSADYRILRKGTAYVTDCGMTGDYDSVVGMKPDEPVRRFTTGLISSRFEPADGIGTMCGLAVDVDDQSGLATNVAPVRLGDLLENCSPTFW